MNYKQRKTKTSLILWAIIVLIFSGMITISAQANIKGGGASRVAMADIQSVRSGIFSLYGNPAGLAFSTNKYGIDLSAERRFNLDELATVSAGAYIKGSFGNLGASFVRFGDQDYLEQRIQLSYGLKLLEELSIGIHLAGNTFSIRDYGREFVPGFEVGILSTPIKSLQIGLLIRNPISVDVSPNTTLPSALSMGINFQVSDRVAWMTEVEKNIDRKPALKTGIQYQVQDKLTCMLGVDFTRTMFGIGFQYGIQGFNVAGAYGVSNVLGSTPALSLQYLAD